MKNQTVARSTAFCGLFAALIAVGAFLKITIPVQPMEMHFTLQWFFVILAALLLGPALATISVCTYLAIGLVGLPVFAAGGGPAYLLRPTFGFLLGFALAAWVMGQVSERLRAVRAGRMLLAATAGLFVYYLMGVLYYYVIANYVVSMPVSWGLVLVNACLLTIGEDFILCMLAAITAERLRGPIRRMMG